MGLVRYSLIAVIFTMAFYMVTGLISAATGTAVFTPLYSTQLGFVIFFLMALLEILFIKL
ncbi:MAG: hypothetical protein Q7S92_00640 [Candidatus Diapherotrites archaeon]|nr:hypothetical protein [Candidatus Diapherotrites archaeon]